jgi:hypothetical protein
MIVFAAMKGTNGQCCVNSMQNRILIFAVWGNVAALACIRKTLAASVGAPIRPQDLYQKRATPEGGQ